MTEGLIKTENLAKWESDMTNVDKETQSQTLIRLAAEVDLFQTTEREPFASFKVNDHYETWPLRGTGFKLWLTKKYYEECGKPPTVQGLNDAINVLTAKALFDGIKQEVYLRIAEKENTIYLDLCNENWEVIKVGTEGWEIVRNPPVKFRRSNTAGEISKPIKGGKIDELKKYINYKNETEWKLIIAWLLSALRPGKPFPILTIQGEQGSSKSTTTKVLKALIDPSPMPLRALPKDERDLSIAAKNTWLLTFDNLSGLSNIMSDALCKLSTGGGLATRKLYSDDDEAIFNIIRPAILNGIDDIAKRQDLLDRSIVLLPAISEENRTHEKTFWDCFEKAQPRILGALLDILSGAIKDLPNTKLTVKPRMADFALLGTAAEKALGWNQGDFLRCYNTNRNEAIDQGLESDPLAVAMQAFMEDRVCWEGTVAEALEVLTPYVVDDRTKYSNAWPSARKLKERLRRIAAALRIKGIEYSDLGRTRKGSILKLNKIKEHLSLSTLSSPNKAYPLQPDVDNAVTDINCDEDKEKSSRLSSRNHKPCDDCVDNDYKKHWFNYEKSGLI